jgi:hypothetical protein
MQVTVIPTSMSAAVRDLGPGLVNRVMTESLVHGIRDENGGNRNQRRDVTSLVWRRLTQYARESRHIQEPGSHCRFARDRDHQVPVRKPPEPARPEVALRHVNAFAICPATTALNAAPAAAIRDSPAGKGSPGLHPSNESAARNATISTPDSVRPRTTSALNSDTSSRVKSADTSGLARSPPILSDSTGAVSIDDLNRAPFTGSNAARRR